MDLPEGKVLSLRPGIDRMLRKCTFRGGAVAEKFFAPGLVDVVEFHPGPKLCGCLAIGCHENIPRFALLVAVMPGNRHRAPEIPQVVPILATDVESNQFSGFHRAIQMIVSRQRSERRGKNTV